MPTLCSEIVTPHRFDTPLQIAENLDPHIKVALVVDPQSVTILTTAADMAGEKSLSAFTAAKPCADFLLSHGPSLISDF